MTLVQGTSGLAEAVAELELKIKKVQTEIDLKEGEKKLLESQREKLLRSEVEL